MVDRDVVTAKVDAIGRCLGRIAVVRDRRERMPSDDYKDIVDLYLHRAAQDAIDLAAHVVASERWGVVDNVAQHFAVLEQKGVIDDALALRMHGLVGFRNIAVHQYTDIDPSIVEAIVAGHLDDLRALCAAVLRHFGLSR